MGSLSEMIHCIEDQESTDISYVKIGKGNKRLIVEFASNSHDGFEKKSSLMKLKAEYNNFDVLYLRNRGRWYLGGLTGIGKNINDTIAFLIKEFSKYEDVITIGYSAGGYASILYGSICSATTVVAVQPQTDLEYSIANCLPVKTEFESDAMRCGIVEPALAKQGESKIIPREVYHKYKNLKKVIDPTINYYMACQNNNHGNHGKHHCENLSDFKCVNILNRTSLEEHADNLCKYGSIHCKSV